jgi:hypothetical protein
MQDATAKGKYNTIFQSYKYFFIRLSVLILFLSYVMLRKKIQDWNFASPKLLLLTVDPCFNSVAFKFSCKCALNGLSQKTWKNDFLYLHMM